MEANTKNININNSKPNISNGVKAAQLNSPPTLRWVGGPPDRPSVRAGENGYLLLLDQRKLPHQVRYLTCRNVDSVIKAIKQLSVRGAPLIGVTAAFGFYLGIRNHTFASLSASRLHRFIKTIADRLIAARPTAVNLKWAIDRMLRVKTKSALSAKSAYLKEAMNIWQEDKELCARIGRNGARLIKNGYGILTHCNAGALATTGIGTALAIIYQAKAEGKRFRVYATETRPVLQGARLTVWELMRNKIDTTLICDSMAGKLMQESKIDCVLLGADRIARNGDTANKIGTYSLAVLAKYHRIPFYVAAPYSTFDPNIRTGKDIPIEYRSPEEVTHIADHSIAPRNTKVYNPAFDVTPAGLITAIITEKGVVYHKGTKKTRFP